MSTLKNDMKEIAKINLRRIGKMDVLRLFWWRNDPLTRENSLNKEEIEISEHISWFLALLSDPSRAMFIAEIDEMPVGTIRLDDEGDYIRLSWLIAEEHRGKGYGKAMLNAAISLSTKPLKAQIENTNLASQSMAISCGFSLTETRDNVGEWELTC